MNRISYAVVVFFAGAAIVFGVVIFVYAVATMFDRLSCFNTSSDMLTPQEHEERRVASDLTRRSGLAGMLSSERSRVFRAFFEKRALAYHKTNKGGGDDIEAQKKQTDKTSSTDENKSDVDNRKSGEEAANKQEGSSESKEEVDGQAHNTTDATCPICLNEYGTLLLRYKRFHPSTLFFKDIFTL